MPSCRSVSGCWNNPMCFPIGKILVKYHSTPSVLADSFCRGGKKRIRLFNPLISGITPMGYDGFVLTIGTVIPIVVFGVTFVISFNPPQVSFVGDNMEWNWARKSILILFILGIIWMAICFAGHLLYDLEDYDKMFVYGSVILMTLCFIVILVHNMTQKRKGVQEE